MSKQLTYTAEGEWSRGRADQDPLGFLDAVAATDILFDDVSYAAVSHKIILTPYDEPPAYMRALL